jgi:hypothetical protein
MAPRWVWSKENLGWNFWEGFLSALGFYLRLAKAGALTVWATLPVLFSRGFFPNRVSRAICPRLTSNLILLISASWVARIAGVSHLVPAAFFLVSQQLQILDGDWNIAQVVKACLESTRPLWVQSPIWGGGDADGDEGCESLMDQRDRFPRE